MMEELKPCPFCGGKANSLFVGIQQRIYCENCGASVLSGFYSDKPEVEATIKWNNRHNEK